ncbi:MAG: formimidoylglutamate deiminase [Bacteroidetes bacterium]|nr:MAG: formimidoylglutamate deiminase [Bacteroidota bacterium]
MSKSLSIGLQAQQVLLPDGWATDVAIYWDAQGVISDVRTSHVDPELEQAHGPVVPGMINVHSHAFQRTIVGRTHSFTSPTDDFWTWREVMYQHLSTIGPHDMERIATELYVEMIRAGYTSVCEFHYVHCDPEGNLYPDPDAMSIAILNAAETSGIGLTLLPVFYQFGGFGEKELQLHQNRFVLSLGDYCDLITRLRDRTNGNPGLAIGYAPHSLRAVNARGIHQLLDHRNANAPTSPVHIHVAEQVREVEECMAVLGKRPIEYLFDKAPVDEHWCLIHATHSSQEELSLVASSGATIGLCPTTEADLGDGVFPLANFLELGGSVAIGSDSNICVSPFEELRLLDYIQRVRLQKRNVEGITSAIGAGTRRYLQTLFGGCQAAGRPLGQVKKGYLADLLVLNSQHPQLRDKSSDEQFNTVVYSSDSAALSSVIIRGKKC